MKGMTNLFPWNAWMMAMIQQTKSARTPRTPTIQPRIGMIITTEQANHPIVRKMFCHAWNLIFGFVLYGATIRKMIAGINRQIGKAASGIL